MSELAGELQQFACPVCGRARPLSRTAARNVTLGRASGECPPGSGCRTLLDEAERFRRFWLHAAGVSPVAIRAIGGAREYVLEHGLPDVLVDLADAMPDAPPQERVGRWRKPVQGRLETAA